MPTLTGQQVVSQALTTIDILEQGGTPNTSDSNAALAELNNMWSAWSLDEGLIWAEVPLRFPAIGNVPSYSIGNGPSANGTVPLQIPSRVYSAYFISSTGGAISMATLAWGGNGYAPGDTGFIANPSSSVWAQYTVNTVNGSGAVLTYTLTSQGLGYVVNTTAPTITLTGSGVGFLLDIQAVTATGQNRNRLNIVNADAYYAHRDLSATAMTPDELYVDFNPSTINAINVFLWPVPTFSGALEIDVAATFSQWALTTSYSIPVGYPDIINYALAFRLLILFGVKDQAIIQLVTAEAEKAELRIRKANKTNRQLPEGAEMLSPPQQQQGQPV